MCGWDSGTPTHMGPGTSKRGDAAKLGPLGPHAQPRQQQLSPYLLRPREGVVEAGNVGHDSLLIGLWGVHDVCGMAARCRLAEARGGEWAPVPTQAESSLGTVGCTDI